MKLTDPGEPLTYLIMFLSFFGSFGVLKVESLFFVIVGVISITTLAYSFYVYKINKYDFFKEVDEVS